MDKKLKRFRELCIIKNNIIRKYFEETKETFTTTEDLSFLFKTHPDLKDLPHYCPGCWYAKYLRDKEKAKTGRWISSCDVCIMPAECDSWDAAETKEEVLKVLDEIEKRGKDKD